MAYGFLTQYLMQTSTLHQELPQVKRRYSGHVVFSQATQGGREEAKLGQTLNISQALIHY